jgi:ribonucleotide reductase alpha subunit
MATANAMRTSRERGVDTTVEGVWLRSLTAEQRSEYQMRHAEPQGWGFYRLTFSRPTSSEVPEDKGPNVYWDSLEKHYEKVFGVA